jgi:uncharacterized membrane protein YgaE (UPF0421/DUF939 family)
MAKLPTTSGRKPLWASVVLSVVLISAGMLGKASVFDLSITLGLALIGFFVAAMVIAFFLSRRQKGAV